MKVAIRQQHGSQNTFAFKLLDVQYFLVHVNESVTRQIDANAQICRMYEQKLVD